MSELQKEKREFQFEESRDLSTKQFLAVFQEGIKNEERFCFILGSGASVESGIPMGGTLENNWMKCIMGEGADIDGTKPRDAEETRKLAKTLKADGKLQEDFDEMEAEWNKLDKGKKETLSSKFYFDLYKIRFWPNQRNGYHYLESLMDGKEPSFGYYVLAHLLTDAQRGNNLVITTNFDSLIEDALYLYTNRKPLVINHELLAEYIGSCKPSRPIIAKIHRGMFFDPLNDPEDTEGLRGNWHDILKYAFQVYTPVVIGYGGGDHSLMKFLEGESAKLSNGIYWCYVEKYGRPNEKIRSLVQKNNGCFVRTQGFDSFMLAIGNEMYADEIEAATTAKNLTGRTNKTIERYQATLKKLKEQAGGNKEFQAEVQKLEEQGEKSLQEREKKQEMSAWDYWRKGNKSYDNGGYEEAIRYYTEAIARESGNTVFYNNRGTAYAELRKYEEAIEDYTKVTGLDVAYAGAYNNRGNVYAELGKYKEALEDYTKAIELDASFTEAYYSRGSVYFDLGKYEEAIENYTQAIGLDTTLKGAYYYRGTAYADLGKYEEAIEDYTKVIELDVAYASAYNNRGIVYADLGKYEEAIEDYTKAIGLDATFKEAYNNRGNAYVNLGKYEEAIEDCTKAIGLDVTLKEAYNNRGAAHAKLGKYEEAIKNYTKAIELDDTFKEAYNNRGNAYADLGKYQDAIADYTEAIKLDSEYKKAYIDRGKVFRTLARITEAEQDEKKAEELQETLS